MCRSERTLGVTDPRTILLLPSPPSTHQLDRQAGSDSQSMTRALQLLLILACAAAVAAFVPTAAGPQRQQRRQLATTRVWAGRSVCSARWMDGWIDNGVFCAYGG